jgi:hypothetical protein
LKTKLITLLSVLIASLSLSLVPASAAGAGGLGKASLIPKYANNQLYFELKSVSLFGNEIPASSLPADLQTQIKSKSQRSLTPPKGLKVKSVSLNSKGLSVKMSGNNVQLGNLGL